MVFNVCKVSTEYSDYFIINKFLIKRFFPCLYSLDICIKKKAKKDFILLINNGTHDN